MDSDAFPLARLDRVIDEIKRRLDTLERPSGTSVSSLVDQVQGALSNLAAQVGSLTTSFLASGFTTGSIHATGSVTVDGAVTATSGLSSPDVYSRNLTGSGTSKVVYVAPSGQIGNLPSSRRYKQDIAPAPSAAEALLAMRVVTFRYIAAVELLGDAAEVEWGAIAEELHELGLRWAVIYDESGRPDGVKYERLVLAVIPVVQDHERRLHELEGVA